MDERRTPILNEEPKHKKKSTTKGLPRANHKHTYETVLLERKFQHNNCNGQTMLTKTFTPTKVCTQCGRIDRIDRDPSYYCNSLSEKALNLPRWYTEEYFSKFAIEKE